MRFYKIALFVFLWFNALGQENEGILHKETLSIDELLKKNNREAYNLYNANDNFLVLANYRNGKRIRFFEGDLIRFKTKDGRFYELEISYIDESGFTAYQYDSQIRRMEMLEFDISEIKVIYKHKRGGYWIPAVLSMAGIIPYALIDWAETKIPPWQNGDFLVITPIVGLGNLLIHSSRGLFNKKRITDNRELKIIKPVPLYGKK